MNSGTIWGRFVEKPRGKKSRATVPLKQIKFVNLPIGSCLVSVHVQSYVAHLTCCTVFSLNFLFFNFEYHSRVLVSLLHLQYKSRKSSTDLMMFCLFNHCPHWKLTDSDKDSFMLWKVHELIL